MTPVIVWCNQNPNECNNDPSLLAWALMSIALGVLLIALCIAAQIIWKDQP